MAEPYLPGQQPDDTRFSLPAVDDPASTEVGIILLGLDAERLLAGLGLARESDDPAVVAVLVDQARHGVPSGSALEDARLAGARRWRAARTSLTLDESASVSAAPRQAWAQTFRLLSTEAEAASDPSAHAYLTACWLRRDEVDRRAAAIIVAGRVGGSVGGGAGPSQT